MRRWRLFLELEVVYSAIWQGTFEIEGCMVLHRSQQDIIICLSRIP